MKEKTLLQIGKKTLFSLFVLAITTNLSGYELDGQVGVIWKGFKTEKKVAVSGTFKDISIDIESDNDFSTFLKSSKVTIDTLSFDSGNPFRDNNITSTLFALASAKFIYGKIIEVDTKTKTLTLEVTMNETKKQIPMTYITEDGKVVANGSIDILDFKMKNSYLEFAKKCAGFHQNKSYSDVAIEFTLPFK